MSVSVALVTGSLDHKIRFWDAASGLCTRTLQFGESQVRYCAEKISSYHSGVHFFNSLNMF